MTDGSRVNDVWALPLEPAEEAEFAAPWVFAAPAAFTVELFPPAATLLAPRGVPAVDAFPP